MQQTYSTTIDKKKEDLLLNFLINNRWLLVADKNQYVKYRYTKDNVVVILYNSAKLVIQGSGVDYDSVLEVFERKSISNDKYVPHIGADEVGKGDYFGPLVVCACYIPLENYQKISLSGVTDSKKISDKSIIQIYETVKDSVIYTVEILNPSDYNKDYLKDNNIAILLSDLHARNIIKLVDKVGEDKYNKIVIDQFSTRKDRLEKVLKGYCFDQFHKAESKDIVVACASIIARYYFIRSMTKLNQKYNMIFPFGSSNVINFARVFVNQYGIDELKNVAKISFNITSQL